MALVSPPPGTTLAFGSPAGARRTPRTARTRVVEKPWPKDLQSLGSITVGSLFCRWYTDELYNCEYITAQERQHYNMCGKVVEYCKLFLPGGSVISIKPSEAAALIAWRQQLTQWGQMLDVKVHNIATGDLRENPGKRKREAKPYITPSYKRLTKIDNSVGGVRARVAVQLPTVVDEASPLATYN